MSDEYLKFKKLRDKYDDQIGNKLQAEVLMEKQDVLDLFGFALGRGRAEVKILAKITAVTPKQKTSGNQLETKLLSQFFASDQARLGELFDEWVIVRMEPAPITLVEGVQGIKHESNNINRDDPDQGNLPFSGEAEGSADHGPTAEPAPEGDQGGEGGASRVSSTCPACGGTSYVGEGSEESCDTCGGTGVIWTTPAEAQPRETCMVCEGKCNVPDAEGYLVPCLNCNGIGTVVIPEEALEAPFDGAIPDTEAEATEEAPEGGVETEAEAQEPAEEVEPEPVF